MRAAFRVWLGARSDRERRLIGVAVVLAIAVTGGALGIAARDDLATLSARIAAHERELAAVRRLAAAVADSGDGTPDGTVLLGEVQAAARRAGLAERVAAITPAGGATPDGSVERLALRVAGASLAETVGLLHALDDGDARVGVARLVLRKHPDDPHRFELTVEVTGGSTGP